MRRDNKEQERVACCMHAKIAKGERERERERERDYLPVAAVHSSPGWSPWPW